MSATKGSDKHKLMHPDFESIVSTILQSVKKEDLAELRKDFHARLRITLTQPDREDLVEDLWDFFYDWCVFERKLPDEMKSIDDAVSVLWDQVKVDNQRGLYTVTKIGDDSIKLKELFSSKVVSIPKKDASDFIGISKGDIIEGRIVGKLKSDGKDNTIFNFARKPSFHPTEVHEYILKKVKQFKKDKDFDTYQTWLWLLVGMYLKHRIYDHMPIEKIYDDNSRI